MSTTELIPFKVEAQRVLELFAKQIYQSPLALLRENTQNAFDAIRQRLHRGDIFEPRIDIVITPTEIVVSDNGLGMTAEDLKQHFWQAGSSSKNTADALAAGVVGTFGIGAMASFGIADALTVETESAITNIRHHSRAERDKLSLSENCVSLTEVPKTGHPGTRVTAHVQPGQNIVVKQARAYIAEFVSLVAIPVFVNDELISQKQIESIVPTVPETWRFESLGSAVGTQMTADTLFILSNNAEVSLRLTNIVWQGAALAGQMVLRSGTSTLRTFRSGFGLATVSVNSAYQFGGVVDLTILQPTAGREAITVEGVQLLQSMMVGVDQYVSEALSEREECDASTPFMSWTSRHGRTDLMGRLRATLVPGDRIALADLARESQKQPYLYYEGSDQGLVRQHATEDRPVLQLARASPRRQCEQMFVRANVTVEAISDKPVVRDRKAKSTLSEAENGLAYRLETILDTDYFVSADIGYGTITHSLPILAEAGNSLRITLDPSAQSVRMLLDVYSRDFTVFGGLAKDFARNLIFPRIADHVPSSTRQGADAFLAAIRKTRELFEYGDVDLGSLPQIWEDQEQGRITLDEAVKRSRAAVRTNVQVVDDRATVSASQVVGDVIENERALVAAGGSYLSDEGPNYQSHEATPAISRIEKESSAKLLFIDEHEPPLRGYRCFLALSDRAREEMGEFFLQPHRTSIVWGGQKTLFIFLHHSGEFGLYYDLQTREAIDAPSGGGAFPTATIVLKNAIYIPIPEAIRASFVPRAGELKRFEVRADIIKTEASTKRSRKP
jgi:molecular chaperone HtpG